MEKKKKKPTGFLLGCPSLFSHSFPSISFDTREACYFHRYSHAHTKQICAFFFRKKKRKSTRSFFWKVDEAGNIAQPSQGLVHLVGGREIDKRGGKRKNIIKIGVCSTTFHPWTQPKKKEKSKKKREKHKGSKKKIEIKERCRLLGAARQLIHLR